MSKTTPLCLSLLHFRHLKTKQMQKICYELLQKSCWFPISEGSPHCNLWFGDSLSDFNGMLGRCEQKPTWQETGNHPFRGSTSSISADATKSLTQTNPSNPITPSALEHLHNEVHILSQAHGSMGKGPERRLTKWWWPATPNCMCWAMIEELKLPDTNVSWDFQIFQLGKKKSVTLGLPSWLVQALLHRAIKQHYQLTVAGSVDFNLQSSRNSSWRNGGARDILSFSGECS